MSVDRKNLHLEWSTPRKSPPMLHWETAYRGKKYFVYATRRSRYHDLYSFILRERVGPHESVHVAESGTTTSFDRVLHWAESVIITDLERLLDAAEEDD